MIVVSNTSPIINMAAAGQLGLLRQLYGKIFIPQAVNYEITVAGIGRPGSTEARTLEWIESKEVVDHILVAALRVELDHGEAEAIALAIQLEADLLLLDERQGRKVAHSLGLQFIGILGVLIEAKHAGYILKVKPLLDKLMTEVGFWISDQLYTQILQIAEEQL